nr:MAG TPA: hypothetical protein [Caudoviricetes sp.]
MQLVKGTGSETSARDPPICGPPAMVGRFHLFHNETPIISNCSIILRANRSEVYLSRLGEMSDDESTLPAGFPSSKPSCL